MHKFLILIFVAINALVNAEPATKLTTDLPKDQEINFQQVDSLTYQYYLTGDWALLLKTGEKAIKAGIDFKRLRQRMGYACFIKANYYDARTQYEAALTFDKTDIDTRIFLYYCGLYVGDESYSRFHLSKLPLETQQYMGAKSFRILDAIDGEYNYKIPGNSSRSNPMYWRVGLNSKLGYGLNLYQSFSRFTQSAVIDSSVLNITYREKTTKNVSQNEYFARLSWTPTQHSTFDLAFHTLTSKLINNITVQTGIPPFTINTADTIHYPDFLLFSKYTYRFNRFELSATGSLLHSYSDSINTEQYGIHAGVTLPGTLNIHLKSSLYYMYDTKSYRLLFGQSAGALFFKKMYAQASVTIGDLTNFNDADGQYVYNSTTDPGIFKAGITLMWFADSHLTFFTNYGYETKQIVKSNINYNQNSFTGGIIWKL